MTDSGKNQFYFKTLPILLLLFGISVLLRLPNINRTLSTGEEYATAVSMRILEIWHADGAGTHGFNPVMNYPGEVNKHINNHAGTTGQVVDAEGNYYYISQPPFAWIFAHGCFALFGAQPSVLGLTLINLIFHFLSALMIYLTVCLLTFSKARRKLIPAALVAYAIYLFNPHTLWFQSNVYMADVAGHLPFICCIYTTLKFVMRKQFYSAKYIVFYTLLLFLLCYTSYLGLIFSIVVIFYSIPKLKTESKYWVLIGMTVLVSAVAVALYTSSYSGIAGRAAYLAEMKTKFIAHSSFDLEYLGVGLTTLKLLGKFKYVLFNYISAYFAVFMVLFGFVWIVLTRPRLGIVFTRNGYRFIILSVIPVVFFHLVFLNYSLQNYVALYGSVFLCVVAGILYDKLISTKAMRPMHLNLGVIAMCLFMLAQYWTSYLPGEFSLEGEFYAEPLNSAAAIREQAEDDAVLFIKGYSPRPEDIFYTGRNMQFIREDDEAQRFLQQHQQSKGLIFTFSDDREMTGLKTVKP